MKILLSPDSFKECLPAGEVAAVMAAAVREACPGAEVIEMPLADGGEGTLEVLCTALGGSLMDVPVTDPLGRRISAPFALARELGIIEVARACGLPLLTPAERNPLKASTQGVGELILAAHRAGCRHLLVGLGGSATCDGGAGMMAVPGLREALQEMTVELLCDVDTPFVGPEGAARLFAPQKGASPEDVELLEVRMQQWALQMLAETGRDVRTLPGAGAAGGLGGALMAYAGARAVSGIDKVLDLLNFDSAARDADLVITGEGRSDSQTLKGKVPCGVLRRVRGRCPVGLVSGAIAPEAQEALTAAGFAFLCPVTPANTPLSEALRPDTAARNLRTAVISVSRQKYLPLGKMERVCDD